MPEWIDIATGKKPRSPKVDRFAQSFSVAGRKAGHAADKATAVLLKRFTDNPDVDGHSDQLALLFITNPHSRTLSLIALVLRLIQPKFF